MIKVTIEVISAKGPEHNRPLGTAIIVNDGSGDAATGNYTWTLSTFDNPDKPWKQGTFTGFARQRKGGWDLLFNVLKVAVGARNLK